MQHDDVREDVTVNYDGTTAVCLQKESSEDHLNEA